MGGYSEKCPLCERWFRDRGALVDHVKSHEKRSRTPMRRFSRNKAQCTFCLEGFEDLSEHLESGIHTKDPCPCCCAQGFLKRSDGTCGFCNGTDPEFGSGPCLS